VITVIIESEVVKMPTKPNVSGSLVPVVFVLALFLLLAAVSVSVILAGSGVYENISGNIEANYNRRVSLSYLAAKIRQNDGNGNIYAEKKDGAEMLAVKETCNGDWYVTYIYYYGGYIREIFLELDEGGANGKTINFDLGDGEKIVKSGGFGFDVLNGGITITLTDEYGNLQSARFAFRYSVDRGHNLR